MKTQSIGSPFLGVNNRLPDFALHVPKVGDWLRSAINCDIDNKGNLTRRKAFEKVISLTGAHSIRMTSATSGYVVALSSIYALTLPNTLTLFKVLSVDDPVGWLEEGDDLYYSNGTDSGRITGGVWYPLGMATPESPACLSIGGGLLEGLYQISVSYSNSATGEESGISASTQFKRTTTGGIRVTLPGASAGATHVNIYASGANGEVLQLAATVAVGTATYDLIALPTGRKGVVRFEAPLPAGELFMSNGRLCSIAGSTVYVGEPWRHGYYRPISGRLHFNAPVSVAIENQGGTYIVAGKTHWFPGDLGDVQGPISDPLPFGGVKGTSFNVPNLPLVGWFSPDGLVLADTMGSVKAVTAEVLEVTTPSNGVSAVLTSKGITRVVSCGWCVNLDTKAVTSYSDWDFSSISGGYGTKADGIYLLESDGLVDSTIGLGRLDFGTEALKHLPAVYLGMSSESKMELTVAYVDERNTEQEYSYETRDCSTSLQMQRIDPGKGICANWFDLTLRNTNGSDFTLASISFAPTASTRRI